MTHEEFAPKDAETLQAEVLEDLGLEEYEDNEEQVGKLVARRIKDEEFKASLHADKNKHLEGKKDYEDIIKKAGLDPKTGEKLQAKAVETEKKTLENEGLTVKDLLAVRDLHEEDVEYLLDESKKQKVSVSDLKKDVYMQMVLKTKAEERATAEATNTHTTRKGSKGESYLDKVDKQDETMSKDEMGLAAKEVLASWKRG